MGIYSCLGKNLDEVCKSLYEGKSGIGIDPMRTEYGYRSPLTGIVERPALKSLLDRRSRVCLAEEGEYAYMATAEALRNAGIDMEYLAQHEVGVFYGNDSSAKAVIDAHEATLRTKDTTFASCAYLSNISAKKQKGTGCGWQPFPFSTEN